VQSQGYVPLTGYTGHIQTDATGLIYMRGRFYTPGWHRFVNSDQGVDPESWNQMSYTGGSPFHATDPGGMCGVWFRVPSSQISVEGFGDGAVEPGYWVWLPYDCGGGGESSAGGGTTASSSTPQSPKEKHCEGLATIIEGNRRFINNPKFHGAWGDVITKGSAAIIPSQFGFNNKDAMAPYVSSISGEIYIPPSGQWGPSGWFPLFSRVSDRADDRATRNKNDWSLSQFEKAMKDKVDRLNGSNTALYIEIPGMSQRDTAWVKITVPANLPCPQGTREK
jgi:RHS repeat-associated protein